MSSLDEQWWDLQAAEYVLGTLPDEERQVIARLMLSDTDIQQKVSAWEHILDPLNNTTLEETPPPELLEKILQKINAEDTYKRHQAFPTDSIDNLAQTPKPKPIVKWASLAAAFALIGLLTLGFFNYLNKENATATFPSTIAVLEDEAGTPIWTINYVENALAEPKRESKTTQSNVIVSVVGELPLSAGNSYQLWMVLANDKGVQSVGLIPNVLGSASSFPLPADLQDGGAFAVSLEEIGGVPGPEHGPVVTISDIIFPADSE